MNIVIILAAGSGTRMNKESPKQFLLVDDKPLFVLSSLTFNNHPLVDEIILVTLKDNIDLVNQYVNEFHLNKVKAVIEGGSTRQKSTLKALEYLKENGTNKNDIILIHDAARPLVNSDIITRNIEECHKYEAVETAVPVVDTLIESENKEVSRFLNRDIIYQVQTPQTFRFDVIYDAHKALINDENTDDAGIVIKNNHPVHIVLGDRFNFKVTTSDDLELLEAIIEHAR